MHRPFCFEIHKQKQNEQGYGSTGEGHGEGNGRGFGGVGFWYHGHGVGARSCAQSPCKFRSFLNIPAGQVKKEHRRVR